GLGFYVGPKYAGWRAEAATWQLWHVAQWQKPVIELGLAGVLTGLLFLLFATEAGARSPKVPRLRPPLSQALRRRVLGIAATLGCRDFAGVASISLIGIYLQKAHGMTIKQTGAILGTLMLLSI